MLRGPGAQDALLLRQTAGRFRASLAGKVGGLLALDAALGGAPLRAALLFSSVSAIVAPLGQPNYAAANAALNAWATGRGAQARAACGLRACFRRLQAQMEGSYRACCSGSALCMGRAELTSFRRTWALSVPCSCMMAVPASSTMAAACVLDVNAPHSPEHEQLLLTRSTLGPGVHASCSLPRAPQQCCGSVGLRCPPRRPQKGWRPDRRGRRSRTLAPRWAPGARRPAARLPRSPAGCRGRARKARASWPRRRSCPRPSSPRPLRPRGLYLSRSWSTITRLSMHHLILGLQRQSRPGNVTARRSRCFASPAGALHVRARMRAEPAARRPASGSERARGGERAGGRGAPTSAEPSAMGEAVPLVDALKAARSPAL